MQQLQTPPLAEGEIYVGAIGDKNGDAYHIILLPGDKDCGTWKAAMSWAGKAGGDLPNRIEQNMLFESFRSEFKRDWYWSNQTYLDPSDDKETAFAWCQLFRYGTQRNIHKGNTLCRARAVRRLPI